MSVSRSDARWEGGLKDGTGLMKLGSGAIEASFNAGTRFEGKPGTNPEELLGAAHAGCFSMALSAMLEEGGNKPTSVSTTAQVTLDKVGDGFAITEIALATTAEVPGMDEDGFQEVANKAKDGCPVSKALAGTSITLDAKLIG